MIGDDVLAAPAERWLARDPAPAPARQGAVGQTRNTARCGQAAMWPTVAPKYAVVVKSLVRLAYRGVGLVLPS